MSSARGVGCGLIVAGLLTWAPTQALARPSDVVVVDQPLRTVELVDGESGRVRLTARMGANPHEVEVSPDGAFAVVPIYGDGAVGRPGSDGRLLEVVDLRTGAIRRIDLGRGVRPHDARFAPDGLLYVTAEVVEQVLAVDVKAGKVVGAIPTGRPQSHALAISADGRRAYTANVSTGSVSVLDLVERRLVGVVQAADSVQRLSVSPDGRRVFTHDQRTPKVIAIDTATLKVAETYDFPGLTYASAPTPDGATLIVAGRPERPGAAPRRPSLYFLDLATREVSTVETVGWPRVIGVETDGRSAWTNLGTGHLLQIDLTTRKVRRTIGLERGLDGMALRRRSR
jgi:DNA-binding beta-propeller fold protein YncE